MVSVKKALNIILKEIFPSEADSVPITDALGRVAAEDVTAAINVPTANNSAMDGYALRHIDVKSASQALPVKLKLIGETRAGIPFHGKVTAGCAVKIMTGGVIPAGSDCVVRLEDASEKKDLCTTLNCSPPLRGGDKGVGEIFNNINATPSPQPSSGEPAPRGEEVILGCAEVLKSGFVCIKTPVKKWEYIRFSGEDIKSGKTVLKKGKRLTVADIGLLASLQKKMVAVYKKPTIAILCTGDELIGLDGDYKAGKVVNSNAYSLSAQVTEAGGEPIMLGVVQDDKKLLQKKLQAGLKYDFLLTSGGISVGDYDFIKSVLEELGAKTKVHKVAMRPGKPFSYFSCNDTKIFALPGNPVSSMVAFELFVRPAIQKRLGLTHIFRRKIDAILKEEIQKTKDYKFFIRGIIKKKDGKYEVKPTGPQGSGILMSMSLADGLIITDADKEIIKKGEIVKVIVIDNSFEETAAF